MLIGLHYNGLWLALVSICMSYDHRLFFRAPTGASWRVAPQQCAGRGAGMQTNRIVLVSSVVQLRPTKP